MTTETITALSMPVDLPFAKYFRRAERDSITLAFTDNSGSMEAKLDVQGVGRSRRTYNEADWTNAGYYGSYYGGRGAVYHSLRDVSRWVGFANLARTVQTYRDIMPESQQIRFRAVKGTNLLGLNPLFVELILMASAVVDALHVPGFCRLPVQVKQKKNDMFARSAQAAVQPSPKPEITANVSHLKSEAPLASGEQQTGMKSSSAAKPLTKQQLVIGAVGIAGLLAISWAVGKQKAKRPVVPVGPVPCRLAA